MYDARVLIAAAAGLVVACALLLVNAAERVSVRAVLGFLRRFAIVLAGTYPALLALLALDYAVGGWASNRTAFVLFAFVSVPLLLVFAYAVGALLTNVLLHFVLRRYRWEGRQIRDAATQRVCRRVVGPFHWLHAAMMVGSSRSFADVLSAVCAEDFAKQPTAAQAAPSTTPGAA